MVRVCGVKNKLLIVAVDPIVLENDLFIAATRVLNDVGHFVRTDFEIITAEANRRILGARLAIHPYKTEIQSRTWDKKAVGLKAEAFAFQFAFVRIELVVKDALGVPGDFD
jgi:hypothetical protein